MEIVMQAADVVLSLHAPGTSPGADEDSIVPDGKLGLRIQSGTDAVIVVGTAQQLRERVYEGFQLPVPADVPLVDFPDTVAELTD